MWVKISMAINALLILAVAFLFYKTFKKNNTESPAFAETQQVRASAFSDTANVALPVIAYINGDSIMKHYEFILDMNKKLEGSMSKAQYKIEQEIEKAQAEYDELINYANSKGESLPDDEKQVISDNIMALDYKIRDLQTKEENALYENEAKLQKELLERIMKYANKYASENGIDMVFNYQQYGQIILYGNQVFDITSPILEGLNQEYAEQKIEKK